MKQKIIEYLYNLYLKIRYSYFRKFCKKTNFSDRKLLFEDRFKNLNNFNIKENEFYNDNSVWFCRENVNITNDGLVISCKEDGKEHTSWQGTRTTKWQSGLVYTKGKVEFSMGVWEIEAKFNGGWPAIWLLKNDYIPEGYTKPTIIPEIDVLETINSKFRHTVHWGYTNDNTYRRIGTGSSICKWDDKFHNIAVELLDDGYRFFIDGILTAQFRNSDKEFVTSEKNYILLNGANDKNSDDESDIIFKSIRFYK